MQILAVLTVGALLFRFGGEDQEGKAPAVIDCLYFAVTTTTTVGYGDFVTRSPVARLICSVYILFGTIVLTVSISKLVELSLNLEGEERKQKLAALVKAVSADDMTSATRLSLSLSLICALPDGALAGSRYGREWRRRGVGGGVYSLQARADGRGLPSRGRASAAGLST